MYHSPQKQLKSSNICNPVILEVLNCICYLQTGLQHRHNLYSVFEILRTRFPHPSPHLFFSNSHVAIMEACEGIKTCRNLSAQSESRNSSSQEGRGSLGLVCVSFSFSMNFSSCHQFSTRTVTSIIRELALSTTSGNGTKTVQNMLHIKHVSNSVLYLWQDHQPAS